MFSSILIPLEGSPLAERALDYATLLADAGAIVTLVAVIEPGRDLTGFSADDLTDEEQQLHDHFSRVLDAAAGRLRTSGHAAHAVVRVGDAATEILAYVAETAPDLVVLTTHGRTGFLRWAEGSVAQTILRRAHLPVLIVRPDMDRAPAPLQIQRVIVPLDRSELAERAMPVAKELAKRFLVPLEAVSVLDNWSAACTHAGVDRSAASIDVSANAPAPGTTMARFDVPVINRDLYGEPITAFAEYLNRTPDSLVVMTSRGRPIPAQYPTDSVTEGVVTHTNTPVLVMRVNEGHPT